MPKPQGEIGNLRGTTGRTGNNMRGRNGKVSEYSEETIQGSLYITKGVECNECEFSPPCRLCVYVEKWKIDQIYEPEIEGRLKKDRRYYVKERYKHIKTLRKLDADALLRSQKLKSQEDYI